MTDDAYDGMADELERITRGRGVRPQVEIERLSDLVSESFVGPQDTPAPDCVTCGACCQYFHRIEVLDSDPTPREFIYQLTEAGSRGTVPVGKRLRREATTLSCAALEGEVGREVRCSIYEVRPESCRTFEAGSDRCRALRRFYGLEPPLSDAAAASANERLDRDEAEEERRSAIAAAEIVPIRGHPLVGVLVTYGSGEKEVLYVASPEEGASIEVGKLIGMNASNAILTMAGRFMRERRRARRGPAV